MSRLHRQKLRARARDEHAQFTRGEDPLLQDLVALTKQQVADGSVKPARAKRSRRKAVRKTKAKAKPK